jgi:hypothetical protein
VTSYVGPKAKRDGQEWRAALYREWRVNRTLYLLAALAVVGPWALWLQDQLTAARPAASAQLMTAQRLIHLNLSGAVVGGAFTNWTVLVAAGLGVAVVAYDRLAGGLFVALEGPLTRRAVFGAKLLWGGAVLVGTAVLVTAAFVVTAWATGNAGLIGLLLLHGLYTVSAQGDAFATAVAVSTAMATVYSLVATGAWLAAPAVLGGLVTTLFTALIVRREAVTPTGTTLVWSVHVAGPWVMPLAAGLPNLTPLQLQWGGWPLWAQWALIAGFLAWAGFMVAMARRWGTAAPYERLHDGFFFPRLWPIYYAFLAAVTANAVMVLPGLSTLHGAEWAGVFVGIGGVLWFFWRWLVIRRIQRDPAAPRPAGRAAVGAR